MATRELHVPEIGFVPNTHIEELKQREKAADSDQVTGGRD